MNESNPSGFCVNCGEPMSAATKFCVNCGAERVAAPPVNEVPSPPPPAAPSPAAPTPTVPTPTVPSPAVALPTVEQPRVAPLPSSTPPPPESTRSPNRNRAILAGVIAGLVIAGAAGFAWAKSSDSDHKTSVGAPLPTSAPFTSPTTPTTPLPTEQPTTFTPTTSALDMRSVTSQLDATLTQSAVQVAQLKRVIDQYVSCQLPAADAAVQLQTVVNGRRQIVNDLDQMLATTSAAGRELVILLRKAINFSLQADTFYQASMQNNSATDARVPCSRDTDANWVSARSIDPLSSDAKDAFLNAYLPWAARLGFSSTWQRGDF